MVPSVWLTIAQAASHLGLRKSVLRGRVERGTLPSYSPDGYHRWVSVSDVIAWKDRRNRHPRGPNSSRVVALRNQGYTDRSIAAMLGISYQRVSQIRQRAGLSRAPTARRALCRRCGAEFSREQSRQSRCVKHRRTPSVTLDCVCRGCGAPFSRLLSTIRATSPAHYCSHACRDDAKRGSPRTDTVTKTCTECGGEYRALPASVTAVCRRCYLRNFARSRRARIK